MYSAASMVSRIQSAMQRPTGTLVALLMRVKASCTLIGTGMVNRTVSGFSWAGVLVMVHSTPLSTRRQ
jgi:hypothetical protein